MQHPMALEPDLLLDRRRLKRQLGFWRGALILGAVLGGSRPVQRRRLPDNAAWAASMSPACPSRAPSPTTAN
jgi:hypothetical protein